MRARNLGRVLFVVLIAAAGPDVAAEGVTLASARERWLRGNYAEARQDYETLAKDAKLRSAATVGLSKALESQGDYDAALAAAVAVLKDLPKDADLLARQADLLFLRGRWDEANKAADAALAVDKNQFLAHWVLARLARDRGDLKKAGDEVLWFVRAYNDGDITDPEKLLLVGLASAEHARWHNLSDQFESILTDLFDEAVKKDKAFWPAEYAAGMLLLEKYNRAEALPALEKALVINPNAAEVLTAKGVAALMKFEIKDAETFAERALKINANLPEALRLRADVHLASGDVAAALRELDVARKTAPRDERTLARIGACLSLQNKQAEQEVLSREVEAFDSKPALYWFEMGDRLEQAKHYDEAERCFRKAAALRPTMPGPANSLGMLFMRLGREQEAAPLLEKGFAADPFNVRVSNLRKVLQHLENYATLRTEHFVLRYDAKNDAQLARYMGDYLEGIYRDLSKQFGFAPKEPILIEVFNAHEMFSGRTVALPDLHTIGACTGRMFAMVSPNGKGIRKPFNWARVLRHEIVHVFNLEQTNFLVTHWLTEGLAVGNEHFPRPPVWNQLLRERVPAGNLMNLDTVELGFIRPRNPMEWQMAYCQSSLYVEYLKKTYGPESIGALLTAYRSGLDTGAAIQKVCKVEKAEFEKGYRAYLDTVVAALPGKPAEKKKTLAELKADYEKNSTDPDAAAAFAEALLGRDRVQARKLAEAALAQKKGHARAAYVLSRLERLAGNVKQERAILESALDPDAPDPRILLTLGNLYYDAGEFVKASEVLEQGRKLEPGEPQWLQVLVRVYAQTGESVKQIAVLEELVPTDADDLERRKRLADLLSESSRWADCEKYAREALEIDVRDDKVRSVLEHALRQQKKDAEADRLRELLEENKK